MNLIPKSKFRYYIPQPLPQNKSQNNHLIDDPKIIKNHNNIKFFVSRNFGKDITNSTKNNVQITHNNSTINSYYSKNENKDNKSFYLKKRSSATSVINKDNRTLNNNNKLRGFVSRKTYNINNNSINNNKLNINTKKNTRGENNKNPKLYNSISYGIGNANRSYTNYSIRYSEINNNNNMISVRVTNNNKNLSKNTINNNVKVNKTNIISFGEKRKKNNNTYTSNSNNDLIKHIKSAANKENMINSMNNRITKSKNESKENINLNLNPFTTKNRTEYKVHVIEYTNKERTRRNNKTDMKKEISSEKSIKREKIIYFDESKITNVQIPKDYINTIYYNLLTEEDSPLMLQLKQNRNFMKEQKEINGKMRSILIDWLIDVHFKFGFTDETLFLTVSIIDRYISLSQITRSNFQLLGITALMIACKHEEIDLPKIDDFIYITDHAYVKNEVLKMEYDILNKLNFSFLYPSPIKFFEYLSVHFNFDKKMHFMGKYLMESFLLDVKNFKYKPSIISCACAYIVMKFFKFKNYFEAYDKKFYNLKNGKYSEGNVKECAREICLLVDNINKTNFQACLKKYSKIEQENVAALIMEN